MPDRRAVRSLTRFLDDPYIGGNITRVPEQTIAAKARRLVRAGHLNRNKDSPGIKQGKTLVTRPKPEAVRQQTDHDRLGLGSFGMRAATPEHFRRISDTQTQYRLALQRQ